MDNYERAKIADALRPMHYEPEEFVINQGDDGNSFYFIENGRAVALKVSFCH
jgi:cAMP-dependent protein kinase regulator